MLGFCLLSTIIICDNILRASIIFRINFPQVALVVKSLPANAGDARDVGSVSGSGSSPGEGNGNLLWYFYLENPKEIFQEPGRLESMGSQRVEQE